MSPIFGSTIFTSMFPPSMATSATFTIEYTFLGVLLLDPVEVMPEEDPVEHVPGTVKASQKLLVG